MRLLLALLLLSAPARAEELVNGEPVRVKLHASAEGLVTDRLCALVPDYPGCESFFTETPHPCETDPDAEGCRYFIK